MRKLLVITALLLFAGIAFGQSFQKGGVVGIHEWTLKLNPDVTMNQFLELWNSKALPLMKKAIPEQTPFLLKGVGADNKYEYAGLYYYNSLDHYLPRNGRSCQAAIWERKLAIRGKTWTPQYNQCYGSACVRREGR